MVSVDWRSRWQRRRPEVVPSRRSVRPYHKLRLCGHSDPASRGRRGSFSRSALSGGASRASPPPERRGSSCVVRYRRVSPPSMRSTSSPKRIATLHPRPNARPSGQRRSSTWTGSSAAAARSCSTRSARPASSGGSPRTSTGVRVRTNRAKKVAGVSEPMSTDLTRALPPAGAWPAYAMTGGLRRRAWRARRHQSEKGSWRRAMQAGATRGAMSRAEAGASLRL